MMSSLNALSWKSIILHPDKYRVGLKKRVLSNTLPIIINSILEFEYPLAHKEPKFVSKLLLLVSTICARFHKSGTSSQQEKKL